MGIVDTRIAREKYTCSAIIEMSSRGMLREDHPFQRNGDLHTKSYKDSFIASVIKGEDFDSIKLCEQIGENGIDLWLIDGVQRISEMKGYRQGSFKIGRSIENPIVTYQIAKTDEQGVFMTDDSGRRLYETIEFDLRGKGYNDLPRELQLQFDQCPVEVIKHLNCTDEEVAYHIRRYNHQQSMNKVQIGITYTEKCAKDIKNISQRNKFFVECGSYSEKECKNGTLERVVIESIMSMFYLDSWNKDISKMGQFLDINASKADFECLNEYLNRLTALTNKRAIFNSKNTHIFIALYERFLHLGLEDSRFNDFLTAFENGLRTKEIGGVSFDSFEEEHRNTKDKLIVKSKIDLLEKLMLDYLGVENEQAETLTEEEFIVNEVGLTEEQVSQDMDLYKETLQDLLDSTVKDGSLLLEPENRLSLLAMVAFSYVKDVDLDEWMTQYAKQHDKYIKNQKINYLHMINNFTQFLSTQGKIVA